MAPINADVAEVEARLSAIRLRRNGLTVQRALAGALGTAILAASLVVATALRGNAALFAITTVAAVLGVAACVAYAAWHTRREWLSLLATARLADTRAALDDRLTTLLAVAAATPVPVLRPLLVDQLINARQRWSLDAVAPRRFSRWLALLPLSLLVFVATAFYARPPAVAAARHASPRSPALPAAPLAGVPVVDRSADEEALFAKGAGSAAPVTGSGDGTRSGSSSGGDLGSSPANGDGSDASGTMRGDGANLPAAGGNLHDLRQSIRAAFGAPPEHARAGDGSGDGRRPDGSGRSAAGAGPRSAGTSPAAGPRTDGQAATDDTMAARAATPGAGNTSTEQGAHGGGRGGAGSAGAAGVLGAASAPRMEANRNAPMALHLNAISGGAPSQSEPQRRSAGVPTSTTDAGRSTGSLPDLASEQLADATMQPLEIGPEHEAIIRRLFTRE